MNIPANFDLPPHARKALKGILSAPDLNVSLYYTAALQYATAMDLLAQEIPAIAFPLPGDALPIRRAAALALTAYVLAEQVDTLLFGAPQRRGHHCRIGCAFCCWLPVDVLAHEAITIAAFLSGTLAPAKMEKITQRVTALDERLAAMSSVECIRAQVPCPLLDLEDMTCRIYTVRPHACRQYASFDRDACERALGDPDAAVPTDILLQLVHDRVTMGIAVALYALGIDYHTLDIVSALRIALTEPDAAERWLAGEDVFAAARRSAREPGDVDPSERDLEDLQSLFREILAAG